MPRDHHRHDSKHHHKHHHKDRSGSGSHKSHHHSSSKSRSRSRKRQERQEHQEHHHHQEQDDRGHHGTWHGRHHRDTRASRDVLSPVKSSTMPAMSPVTSHHYHQTLSQDVPPPPPHHQQQQRFAEIDTSVPGHREQTQSRSMMTRESSPVLGYSKPDQSMDYRSKKPSSSSKSQQPSDGLSASHQSQHQMDLQKELSEKIRHRRRSHSMSSKGERGYYNGERASGEEKKESHYLLTGQSIEVDGTVGPASQHGRQLARPSKYNDQTSSNDTVFYDKELLSDLYSSREKDIKCTDITRAKRTRTKSESRGISEENSPTRISANDNDKIVNLLKGNRRPLEVDAREFRVLKEKLLREQQLPSGGGGGNLKRESKKFKSDFQESNHSRPKNVECELKFSDKINGRVTQPTDDEVFWREQAQNNHKEIVLDQTINEEDVRLKPKRKSRRENFEIEIKDYKHKPFLECDSSELKQRRPIDSNKTSLEKQNSKKEIEEKLRESLAHHYTREEKEWLKEKLLEEFERQEKMQKDADCQSGGVGPLVNSKGSFLPGHDRVEEEKENPINFMMSSGMGGDKVQPPIRKQSQLSSSLKSSTVANGHHLQHQSHGHCDTDKSELGDVSPPCTCGAGDHSPDPGTRGHGDLGTRGHGDQQPPEVTRQGSGPSQRYKTSQNLHVDNMCPDLPDRTGNVTKTPDMVSVVRKSAKTRSSGTSKDWGLSELVDLSVPRTERDIDNVRTSSMQVTNTRMGKESPVKKDSLSSGGHLQIKTSPSVHSRHSSAVRERATRDCSKPATIPRESSPSKSRFRDVSPAVVSISESCDHFQITHGSHDPVSTKQNSRHSFSCESSLPRSPPPYVHPKAGCLDSPGHTCHAHQAGQVGQGRPGQECGCTSCDCGYTSEENMHGHVNGGFHRNGSVRSGTDCHPLHADHGAAGGAGGGHNHHSLEHSYKDHLPLYPDMDNTRGKVNIVIFSGGIKLRRQHWCFLALVLVVLIICLGVLLPNTSTLNNLTKEEQKNLVAQILTEVPLIDGHNDLPWNIRQFIHNKLDKVNLSTNIQFSSPWSTSKWSHTDLYRMRKGMVGCQLWTAYAPCGSQHKDAVQITLEQIDLIKRLVDLYPDYLQLVHSAQEIVDAHKGGKIASLITVESGHSIGTSLGVLRTFQRLGVRALTLTHNCDTPWADCSNADKPGAIPQHNGLTQFGKTVVQEMNKLGLIVDLSHTSVQTARDALATSQAPVIFSHSSAHAICNASRNVPDDVLRIVAEKGGLVMVNFFSYFLTCSNHSTLNDVINHINHIRNVAGIDSVGIGASYDGINEVPVGLPDVGHYPELFVALLDTGTWSLEDLSKLAGLNFLRVLKEVEKIAAELDGGS